MKKSLCLLNVLRNEIFLERTNAKLIVIYYKFNPLNID